MSSSFVKDCSDVSSQPPSSDAVLASSSSSSSAAPNTAAAGGGNKTVFIIVNNDTNIDQDQLSSILATHASSTSEVSVVQMAGTGGGGASASSGGASDHTSTLQAAVGLLNPGPVDGVGYEEVLQNMEGAATDNTGVYAELPLDEESLQQLLSLDEAKHLLGSDYLLDMNASQQQHGEDESEEEEEEEEEDDTASGGRGKRGGRGRRGAPKRRSQRQQDKAERDEVTKIREENQRMLQQEREQMKLQAAGSASSPSKASDSTEGVNQTPSVSKLDIDVRFEFDHMQQKEEPNEDGKEVKEEVEESEEEEEEEEVEDDEFDKKHVEYSTRGKGGGNGKRGAVRGGARGKRGGGRGRGALPSLLTPTEGGRRAAATLANMRVAGGARAARGRGRPSGRAGVRRSKGKQIPVMPPDEDEDDIDELEKRLSDLHGAAADDEQQHATQNGGGSASTAPESSSNVSPQATPAKKILFLKKGAIGSSNKSAIPAKQQPPEQQIKTEDVKEEEEEEVKVRPASQSKEVKSEEQDEDYVESSEEEDEGDDDWDEGEEQNNVNDTKKTPEKKKNKKESPDAGGDGEQSKKKPGRKKKLPSEKQSPLKKKKTIQRIIDKTGKLKYVTRKIVDDSPKVKEEDLPKVKRQQNPQDYFKILEMAQKNVQEVVTHKKPVKSTTESKHSIKKIHDNKPIVKTTHESHVKNDKTFNETPIKVSKDVKIKKSPTPSKGNENSAPESPKKKVLAENKFSSPTVVNKAAILKNSDMGKGQEINRKQSFEATHPQLIKSNKKQKIFSTALEVPYESLKKPKFVKKLNPTSPQEKLSSQKFLEAKIEEHNRIKAKKEHFKKLKMMKAIKDGVSKSYKEEFDDEDEDLDDEEEYAPMSMMDAVRRSKRAPKKKSFGDEMIMLDDKEGEEIDEGESDAGEHDNDKSRVKTSTASSVGSKTQEHDNITVNLEVVESLPNISGDPDDLDYEDDDEERASSDDDYVEEDDPEKLWCICQRPHNNRFMICCDKCEDWFHGSCVNITKAMGKQMEEAGQEWVCPRCKKETRPVLQKQSPAVLHREQSCSECGVQYRAQGSLFCSRACTLANASSMVNLNTPTKQHLNTAEVTGRPPTLEQQVKSQPRVLVMNKHSGKVLTGKDAPTLSELTEFLKHNPDYTLVKPNAVSALKKNAGRVTVDITKAAAAAGLSNASKGAQSAPAGSVGNHHQTPERRKTILLTTVKAPHPPTENTSTPKEKKPQNNPEATPTTPKPVKEHQVKKRSRSESESKPEPTTPVTAAPSTSDIRHNVRKVLTESLCKRAKDCPEEFSNLSEQKITELAKTIEHELFVCYDKSINFKYKSKYRSLVFNIKDTKNGGLFRQILTGAVTPQKLAKMTSDQMASKELAEWRQREGKKEIEAIQKHELEMISLGNTYIMKSHKGEIEIDKDEFIKEKLKAPDQINHLPEESPAAAEDVADSAGSKSTPNELKRENSKDKKSDKSKSSSKHSRTEDKEKRKRHHSESYNDEDSTSKRHHRDDRRDRKDSKDSRRSSRDDRRDRDKKDRDKRDRDHRRDRDKKDRRREDDDEEHKSEKKSESERRDEVSSSTNIDAVEDGRDREPSSTVGPVLPGELTYMNPSPPSTLPPPPPNFPTHLPNQQPKDDPIEDMIPSFEDDPSYIPPYSPGATPPESPIPGTVDDDEEEDDPYIPSHPSMSPSTTPPPHPSSVKEDEEYSPTAPPFSSSSSKSSRSSTASSRKSTSSSSRGRHLSTPISKLPLPLARTEPVPIWRGSITMKDVATFSTTAYEVSGGSINFSQDVPETVEVVGRIDPHTVFPYLASTKKTATKEILVVRFEPISEEERSNYVSLYSYLASKKRYGVVGNCDKAIKDFYLMPLSSHQPLPQVLLPLDGPGFEEHRSHMIVGVIIRTKPKRIYDSFSGTWKDVSEYGKLSEESNAMLSELKDASERSFTPPIPGDSKTEIVELVDTEDRSPIDDGVVNIDEEGLTPPPKTQTIEEEDDDVMEIPVSGKNTSFKRPADEEPAKPPKKARPDTDLSAEQESLLAELNRQIEEHKKELTEMQQSVKCSKEAAKCDSTEKSLLASQDELQAVEAVKQDSSGNVGLDTTKIDLPDNLHSILQNIRRKEEEIKQKEEEILKRKNEALGIGGGDTDLRLLLPQSAVKREEHLRPDQAPNIVPPQFSEAPVYQPSLPPPVITATSSMAPMHRPPPLPHAGPPHSSYIGDHSLVSGPPLGIPSPGVVEIPVRGPPGLPDHRRPSDHRGPPGPPDHRGPLGPPDHRGPLGPPDHRGPLGPLDHRELPGPLDHRGPPPTLDSHRRGLPPPHSYSPLPYEGPLPPHPTHGPPHHLPTEASAPHYPDHYDEFDRRNSPVPPGQYHPRHRDHDSRHGPPPFRDEPPPMRGPDEGAYRGHHSNYHHGDAPYGREDYGRWEEDDWRGGSGGRRHPPPVDHHHPHDGDFHADRRPRRDDHYRGSWEGRDNNWRGNGWRGRGGNPNWDRRPYRGGGGDRRRGGGV